MNVLSLFDGMGCGWIALRELGIKVDRGYSSEVDKYAIAQVKLNFPEVIHLGSVTDIDVSKLEHIDLLIGGSPCDMVYQCAFAEDADKITEMVRNKVKAFIRKLKRRKKAEHENC